MVVPKKELSLYQTKQLILKINIMTATQKQLILDILKAEAMTARVEFSSTEVVSSDAADRFEEMNSIVKAFKAIDVNRLNN